MKEQQTIGAEEPPMGKVFDQLIGRGPAENAKFDTDVRDSYQDGTSLLVFSECSDYP
jgi:hypothetical protein